MKLNVHTNTLVTSKCYFIFATLISFMKLCEARLHGNLDYFKYFWVQFNQTSNIS